MAHSLRRRTLPPLTALHSFEAAAHYGSISRAADVLGVTHGAVSRQVKLLEAWAGVLLFERVGKRIRLTEAGRQFSERATAALDELAHAGRMLQASGIDTQVFVIDALPTFAMRWLLPRLSGFQSRHPQLELRLVTSVEPLRRGASSSFDVAIRRDQARAQPGYLHEAFLSEKEVPVCHPSLIEKASSCKLDDLMQYPLLAADTRPGAWDKWFAHAGVSENAHSARFRRFDHFYLALQAAIDGFGFVLGPLPLIADELKTGRLVSPFNVPDLEADPYCWFVPTERRDDPLVGDFINWLAVSSGQAN